MTNILENIITETNNFINFLENVIVETNSFNKTNAILLIVLFLV